MTSTSSGGVPGDRHAWIILALVALLASPLIASCGSKSDSPASQQTQANDSTAAVMTMLTLRTLSLSVSTRDEGLAGNNDDVTCTFALTGDVFEPTMPITYTVRNESGTLVALGSLANGMVVSKPPSYRCSTEMSVTLTGPATFLDVEFSNGDRTTGSPGSPLTVELINRP